MKWQRAFLLPDPEEGWAWAEKTLVGVPCLLRTLVTLKRAGLHQVWLSPTPATPLRTLVETSRYQRDLPELIWLEDQELPALPPDAPLLGVCGGFIFTPPLIHWYQQALEPAYEGTARLQTPQDALVFVSFFPKRLPPENRGDIAFAQLARLTGGPTLDVPPHLFCRPVAELTEAGQDRQLLPTVGKPTDRWHVVAVRSRTFPILRWLANHGITPNHVTWAGFGIGLLACLLIMQGKYWLGIAGAVLLYMAWVVDCLDGTLARLTFTESPAGQKLDTRLGLWTNLGTFGAIIWAVYGHESVVKAAISAGLIGGGIAMAHRVTEAGKRLPRHGGGHTRRQRLTRFLDKINHRDYAVWVFLLALLNAFEIFLWLSLVGVQVFWLLYSLLVYKQRQRVS